MPELYSKKPMQTVLCDSNTFATTLVIALLDHFGAEFLKWSPETILLETDDDFGIKLPGTNFDRLMAGVALVTTDGFYTSLPDFIELCNILSGAAATPGVFDPADAAECAWGITEALLLSPPEGDEPFDEEIRAYIGKVIEMEGIIVPPDILGIGIVDNNKRTQLHNDFSDDPIMYGAIWDSEASKTEEINSLVKDRLNLLINQLASLQLRNGETADIAKKMLTNLTGHKEGGEPLLI